jgi:hypothetical protein
MQKEESKDFLKNTIRYRDEGTFRVLKTLTTLVACLLPIAGIAVLNVIQYMPTRLGMIAIFTALFSFTLNLTTAARMKDIFSATAALVSFTLMSAKYGRTDRKTDSQQYSLFSSEQVGLLIVPARRVGELVSSGLARLFYIVPTLLHFGWY